MIYQHSTWTIDNGEQVFFLLDKLPDRPIVELWNVPASMHASLNMKVKDFITKGTWNTPSYFHNKDRHTVDNILQINLPLDNIPDKLNWNTAVDGSLTNKLSRSFLDHFGPVYSWGKQIWTAFIPPSRSFIVWRFLHNRLPTDDNLRKRGCYIVSICLQAGS